MASQSRISFELDLSLNARQNPFDLPGNEPEMGWRITTWTSAADSEK
jgi:hypothetical protein